MAMVIIQVVLDDAHSSSRIQVQLHLPVAPFPSNLQPFKCALQLCSGNSTLVKVTNGGLLASAEMVPRPPTTALPDGDREPSAWT
ncbi:unnamed protein product [Linum trigynum]|uniref:Uncharacterized protein n=1 Tax=Linum trigynum TaxID=586398 RepID=A0AAV2CUF8_9ROSI